MENVSELSLDKMPKNRKFVDSWLFVLSGSSAGWPVEAAGGWS